MRTIEGHAPFGWRRWLLSLGCLILALTLLPSSASAQDPSPGESLFAAKCVSCHTVGGGKLVGPDLLGVTARRDIAWLRRWMKEPDRMLAEGDATAAQMLAEYNNVPMPNLALTDAEVAALLAYFESVDTGAAPVPASAAAPLPAGDAGRGKALFMGATRLANGGPFCLSCHTVAGIGALGGGALGPDLTGVYNRYGGLVGLAAFLSAPSTITMNAVWLNQPMTDQERADLAAFFESTTAPVRAPATLWALAGLSIAGCAGLMVAAHVGWRKRLRGVRKPMVARANTRM